MPAKPKKKLSTKKAYIKHQNNASDDLYTRVMNDIKEIRAEFESSGLKINCAEFHRRLKLRYPFAVMWYSPDHVMTQIQDRVYDKRGHKFHIQQFSVDSDGLTNSFRWPVHNGPLDGTDDD